MPILNIHQKKCHAQTIGVAKRGFKDEKYTAPKRI
jgi:hypothetical protein